MHMEIAAQQHGSRHDTGRITTSRPRASLQAGFQLVEMLIVIAILGIISFVAIPSYLSFLDKVDYVTAETDITDISVVIEQFYSGHRQRQLAGSLGKCLRLPEDLWRPPECQGSYAQG
ncbi:MAG: prepilin-type N-terminal cleavage/methylation domain-containing protein [Deltaproteobacteria bacterium]|nr:prepilin-type N-terminal cleavage/methylation domain-containing protein [Deltaproteobacteria bacterium]